MKENIKQEQQRETLIAVKAMGENVYVKREYQEDGKTCMQDEKLKRGEVLLCKFSEEISTIKISGNATILTPYGTLASE